MAQIWRQQRSEPFGACILHTAPGDIIQMSLKTPKVMGDYLCNSHLPISELQVHSGGMGLGIRICVCINSITKHEKLFIILGIQGSECLSPFFFSTMLADWQLEQLQGFDGHETLPS